MSTDDSRQAEAELLMRNEGLVRWVVRSVAFYGADRDDLHQAARLALLLASRRWIPGRAKLSTFAIPYMREAAREAARSQERLRVPDYRRRVAATASTFSAHFELATGRRPTRREVADGSGLSPRVVGAAERAIVLGRVASIDQPVELGDGESLAGESLADTEMGPAERVAAAEAARYLRDAVDLLPTARERWIVVNRYGLNGDQPRTLASLGRDLGISRERVRQILDRSLGVLRECPTIGALR